MCLRSFALTLLCSGFLAGCGYSTTSLLPSHLKTIAVKPFTNDMDPGKDVSDENEYRQYRAAVEIKITNAIRDRFLLDGQLKLAPEPKADIIVEGAIIDHIRDPIRVTEAIVVDEYRITMVLRVKVFERATGQVLWESKRLYGDTTFVTTGAQSKTEDQALNAAVLDVARRVVERTIEGW